MMIFFCSMLGDISMSGAQRLSTLMEDGYGTHAFRQDPYMSGSVRAIPLRYLARSPFRPDAVAAFNRDLLGELRRVRPKVAWLEKPLLLLPNTLLRARDLLPDCTFVCFQDDDPFGERTEERALWRSFVACIPHFDLHFVKRPENLDEFASHGARRVAVFTSGFFAPLFCPSPATSASVAYDVVFVGTALDHRKSDVAALLSHYRLPLDVYGDRWNRTAVYYRHRSRFHAAVWSRAYADVLRSARIALGYVSSSNRDEYSMRTFEIPAVRTFLLAERTQMHMTLFEEGREAEFFSSPRECAEKVRFYLANDSARERIAAAGYRRCIESDYSLRRRMRDAMALVG
jgi:spore maturation protein CgeB